MPVPVKGSWWIKDEAMSHEAALWLRFLPLLGVVIASVMLYVLTKRRRAISYPPGRGLRLFDKEGNEIKGPLRIVTAVALAVAVIVVIAFVVLPFTITYP